MRVLEAVPVKHLAGQHDQATHGKSRLASALLSAEKEMVSLQYERACAFDQSGKQIYRKDGTAAGVEIGEEQTKKLAGSVFTHNHPNSPAGFALIDVRFAVAAGLAEMRVVGNNGVMSFRPGKKGWGAYDRLEKIYDRQRIASIDRLPENSTQAERARAKQDIWKNTAREAGLVYKFYPSSKKSFRAFELRHLSGQHDQSTHGSGGFALGEIQPLRDGGQKLPSGERLPSRPGTKTTGPAVDFIKRGRTLSRAEQQTAKSTIVSVLSERLLARADLQVSESDAPKIVQKVLGAWATTSSDSNATSIALQRIAQEEFGLSKSSLSRLEKEKADIWDSAEYRQQSPVYRAILRDMYEYTQEEFAKAGIKEVALFRGLRLGSTDFPPEIDKKSAVRGQGLGKVIHGEAEITLNPLSSFTAYEQITLTFNFLGNAAAGSGGGYLTHIATKVPVERIISTGRTGIGCLNEHEYVVLGGAGKATVTIGVGDEYTPRY